jgi:competence protein ComEA
MNPLKSLALAALLLCPAVPALADVVDLNTADAATLARELKGIGESRAKAIVEHRTRNGPFRTVDELVLVKGIGPRVVEQNRASLRVSRTGPAVPGASSTRSGTPPAPGPAPVPGRW